MRALARRLSKLRGHSWATKETLRDQVRLITCTDGVPIQSDAMNHSVCLLHEQIVFKQPPSQRPLCEKELDMLKKHFFDFGSTVHMIVANTL